MQFKIREYYYECYDARRSNRYRDLAAQMSPELKGKLSTYSCKYILKVRYFRIGSHEFLGEVFERLKISVFSPKELIFSAESLMILYKGVALSDGRVLSKGSIWSEDFILTNSKLQILITVVAFTYCNAQSLVRECCLCSIC